MEEEPTGRGSGVNGIGQPLELYSLFLKFTDEVDQVLDAAAKPIKFPNHKGVPRTEAFPRLGKAEAFSPASARPIFKDLRTAPLWNISLLQQRRVCGVDPPAPPRISLCNHSVYRLRRLVVLSAL